MEFQVAEILGADIYRDGGSRCFWFSSDDGKHYEFFLKRNLAVSDESRYKPPVLYLGSVNDRQPVREFSWEEAIDFVSGLEFDYFRFEELVNVVMNKGKVDLSC